MSRDEDQQAATIAFLSDPATHGGSPVERLSTHAAHIFLAGEQAFKLKRAITLPFLDFSTPEKRCAMLEKEIQINGTAAPGLYLTVKPLFQDAGGHVSFAPAGPPVDWVLLMRRFPQEALLDNLAQSGALDESTIDALAISIAEMHSRASVTRLKHAAYFREMARDNIRALQNTPLDQAAVRAVEIDLGKQFEALADHLDRRAAQGFVRRCHGDLHLGNIVMLDGRPTPFDALEFDDALALGDVYYDLAFLLMDLEHRGLRASANPLLNRYVSHTDDIDGLRALRLFIGVRALIRAKVAAIAATQSPQPEQHWTIAKTYLDLAASTLKMTAPRLIGIGGLSGTGKSVLAAGLAPLIEPAPGALLLRSDVLRKRLFGVDETTRLPRGSYTPSFSAKVYARLFADAGRALASEMNVIVDAVFAHLPERQALENVATATEIPFVGIWLEAPLNVRMSRVGARVRDASDADIDVVKRQASYETGGITWIKCNVRGSKDENLRKVLTIVAAPG